ncbi:MAG: PaaI family thioesterase [Candidatus Omnitrophica bacterium]|nr:hypothetical protein [bacterium]NUN98144.1 PaaI family thioesterase [Candidatus Omnitrophota bacterium]
MSHPNTNGKRKGLPHSKGCFVCGEDNPDGFRGKFELDERNHVRFHFIPRQTMQGYGTVMHGGLQATILDETMGWATAVASGRMTVLAEINVRYLLRTPIGEELIAEAWATEVKKRLVKAEAVIRDKEGVIYARAHGKFTPLSEEETRYVDSHLIYHEGDLRIFDHLSAVEGPVHKVPI